MGLSKCQVKSRFLELQMKKITFRMFFLILVLSLSFDETSLLSRKTCSEMLNISYLHTS